MLMGLYGTIGRIVYTPVGIGAIGPRVTVEVACVVTVEVTKAVVVLCMDMYQFPQGPSVAVSA